MSKIHAKIGAVLIAVTAGFVTISAGTASTAGAADCHDGVILWNYYMSIEDYATANGLLANLIGMGCADWPDQRKPPLWRVHGPAVPAVWLSPGRGII